MRLDTQNVWSHWIHTIAKQSRATGATADIAVAEFLGRFDEVLTSKMLTLVVTAPLVGLEQSALPATIPVARNVEIRALSANEIEELYAHDITDDPRILGTHEPPRYVISTKRSFQFQLGAEHVDRSKLLDDAIAVIKEVKSALHVAGEGGCTALSYQTSYEFNPFPDGGHRVLWPGRNPFAHLFIGAAQRATLAPLFNRLQGLGADNKIRRAVQRLVDAEHRSTSADAVVDAVVGLELLLGTSGSAIAYTVALNYAFLGSVTDRKARFDAVSAVQTQRSKLVHGSAGSNLGSAPDDGKRVLRDALRTVLMDPAFQGVELDRDLWLERIFSGAAPPALVAVHP